MDFKFLHAADIHLDSPLRGLARYEGVPADLVRTATRNALDNLVSYPCPHAVTGTPDFKAARERCPQRKVIVGASYTLCDSWAEPLPGEGRERLVRPGETIINRSCYGRHPRSSLLQTPTQLTSACAG